VNLLLYQNSMTSTTCSISQVRLPLGPVSQVPRASTSHRRKARRLSRPRANEQPVDRVQHRRAVRQARVRAVGFRHRLQGEDLSGSRVSYKRIQDLLVREPEHALGGRKLSDFRAVWQNLYITVRCVQPASSVYNLLPLSLYLPFICSLNNPSYCLCESTPPLHPFKP